MHMTTIFGPYSIRNLRPKPAAKADNGYTATLLRNGNPVAHLDCGTAPDNDDLVIQFSTEAEMNYFKSAVQILYSDHTLGDCPTDECFLRDLVESTYHASRLEALSKRNTFFRLDGDPPTTWRQVRAPYRRALEAAIRARYPRRQVEFARFAGAAAEG